jgi:uridine kinase
MESERLVVLGDIAARIGRISLGHPLRVAIDGQSGAGKTTLSDELAALIARLGRPAIRASIDGFHRPKVERYARGRYSAAGYYYDARDHAAIMRLLLIPLGPSGSRLYRTTSFDLEKDQPAAQEPLCAPDNAVLIVDGTFLQRPELRDGWDLTIFVKTSAELAERRLAGRDAGPSGGPNAIREAYGECYRAAFELYEDLCAPEDIADVVLTNDDLERPSVLIREGSLLAMPVTN